MPTSELVPKKRSARCAPVMALPVSFAIIRRFNGLAPPFQPIWARQVFTKWGSIAKVRSDVSERFLAPSGPLCAGTRSAQQKNKQAGLFHIIFWPSSG